jgi:methyl-accepting chemotaxis protein
MNAFSQFGIAKRLYLISFVLIVALGGVATTAWIKLTDANELAHDAGSVRAPQMDRIADIELSITRTSLQLRHAMLVKTPADLAATLADIGDKRKHIDELFANYGKAVTSDTGRETFKKLSAQAAEFWAVAGENLKSIQAGKKDEAFAILVDKTIPVRNLLLKALDTEKSRQRGLLSEELESAEHAAINTRNLIVGLVVGVAMALITFSTYIGGVLRRRVAASQALAEEVRDGNLNETVASDERDEFTPLLGALSEMRQSLARIVGSVRQNAESVATASAQIAQGNNDLSGRTEEQASALEETAASMEQLSSTVKQNADNAKQANQLALGASTVAIKGGEVVGQVVQTMKGINDSSKKIADIISVIDGIAFQTNILALNAAVEAARAGEQGRGFAVVASEVRSLAGRSADAAKEIKTLITASVERVEQGTALVDQAGTTMSEVVSSIKRVTDIMGEISAASQEQSAGVAQVGEAITQMDQATQQNAALVEESAAAAESLKGQAQQLVQAVAVFQLSATESRAAAAPAAYAGSERRGPDRAKNVTRPAFGAKPARAKAPAVVADATAAKTGTDGEWASF